MQSAPAQCRMAKDLMATEDLNDLGLGDKTSSSYVRYALAPADCSCAMAQSQFGLS